MSKIVVFITDPFVCSSLLKVIDNLSLLFDGIASLPPNLKARILHLMQKRGLVSDENIAKVCIFEMSCTLTIAHLQQTDFYQYYLCCSEV